MLRKTVILLIVLNLVWWVWARGWLAPLGLPPSPAGEPERLTRQINPDALHVQPRLPGTASTRTAPAQSDAATDPQIPSTTANPTDAPTLSRRSRLQRH